MDDQKEWLKNQAWAGVHLHLERLKRLTVGNLEEGLEVECNALEKTFMWFFRAGLTAGEEIARKRYYMDKNARSAAEIEKAERIRPETPQFTS